MGAVGKIGRFLRRPLRILGLATAGVGAAEFVLSPPPGGSQSILGIVTDTGQNWNQKGINIMLAAKGQITNPAVIGELVGGGVLLWLSSKFKI